MQGIGLLTRPEFSSDLRSPLWTDGKGPQDQYAETVSLWKLYHDSLSFGASEKIQENLQSVVLKQQLFDRARDLARTVPQSV